MSHIVGIGVDVENVPRFTKFEQNKKNAFLQRVFTEGELDYCFSQARPAEHLAGRYAAKEAVVKALSGIIDDAITYNEIEIRRSAKEAPVVRIERLQAVALDIQVSFSHTSDVVVAFAVVSGEKSKGKRL